MSMFDRMRKGDDYDRGSYDPDERTTAGPNRATRRALEKITRAKQRKGQRAYEASLARHEQAVADKTRLDAEHEEKLRFTQIPGFTKGRRDPQ